MKNSTKLNISCKPYVQGAGLVNSIINKLPFELHLPGYQYCGPGTKLQDRLIRGDPGINRLDRACKDHDIAYSKFKNTSDRHIADKILAEKAWQRAKSVDSSLSERANAYLVSNAMKLKVKTGMGLKRKKSTKKSNKKKKKSLKKKTVSYREAVARARETLKATPTNNLKDAIKVALRGAREAVKGKKKNIKTPRVIPVPKTGGILPFLIPLFAGLSAAGTVVGNVANYIRQAKSAKKQLDESSRHNRVMETVAMGKGLYLGPYKKGLGLFISPYSKNS